MSQMLCSYVEYKIEHEHAKFSLFGKVYLERDYTFFALLGGGPRQDEIPSLFGLRGMPADANPLSSSAYHLIVTDKETDKERWVSRREAEQWVEQEAACWVGENWITDPDYFSPSWLTTEEFTQVYSEYQENNTPLLASVEAAIAAMRLLPEARVVFWFGN